MNQEVLSPRSRRWNELAKAASHAGVVWAGLFALGIGLGVVVTAHGLPWWLAPIISGVLFAGSVEFILIGMLSAGASVPAIALTTFLVNSRHLFYGISFPLDRVGSRIGKSYSMFALCDEAYALITALDARALNSRRILWTQCGLHLSWVAGATAGGLAGASFLSGLKGLDFVLIAMFLVLTLDTYRARPDIPCVALAVVAALTALVIAPGAMVLVAMCCYTATLIARHHLTRRLSTEGQPAHA
ncbi:AzlC family ABC transporter permease [Mycobacteroides salmoniphilum]|uniref:Inner membrane protein YgaZ n=1 Tax=Mycobacteroides salmoniphilum TaxID=404941 RepID=A0A4R8SEP7_9MYCO|nr:AzlC family ABC transporter permease [Mycobacteroides salmoniphilum]TDZ95306.1 Inner membrane protein YgaZ [Mycobacteroides salmoniphilum]TEA04402.1 Inner membrane protein YgaZ [Mycobacteroides salmoniphilum]